MAYLIKLKLSGVVLILALLNASVQSLPAQSSKKLLLAIQQSKADTNRISLQLKLGDYYLYNPNYTAIKEGESASNLDSAINLFNLAVQLSINLHESDWEHIALDRVASYYKWVNDPKRYKQSYMRNIAYYKQKGDLAKEAHAWENLGNAQSITNNLSETISSYQHARSLYLQNRDAINAAGILIDIGTLRKTIQPNELGEKEIRQGLAEYQAIGYKKLQGTYSVLFQLEYNKGNYYRALDYCLQGINNSVAGESNHNLIRFYFGAAKCNYAVKKYKEALYWAEKTMAIYGAYPDHKYFLIETLLALNRTDEAFVKLNEIANEKVRYTLDTLRHYKCQALYYDKKNNCDLAVRYYVKTSKFAKKVFGGAANEIYINCDNRIAENYLKINHAAKAERYINDAASHIKLIKRTLQPEFLIDFYNISYKYYLATGNDRSALQNLAYRVKVQDSLFTADKDKQLTELNIQYKTVQKEQSIKLLHSENAAQQSSVEKTKLQRNITIAGILVMIMVSALFYRNYRQKQFANQLITEQNKLLQHLLTEKEWLLKEVHHRVKNNLHSVICLLESQAAYLENDALKAIEKSQHRIYAMSLIHQKLYQSDDIKTIAMAEYIPQLVASLEDGFDTIDQVRFKLQIDPIHLDVSQAIPLGLIINEAVTNSIKYAFPDQRKGEISIRMTLEGEIITFQAADNGVGIPAINFETEPTSLGLLLIKGLSKDIDADATFEVDQGTKITLVFKLAVLNAAASPPEIQASL